MLLPPQLLLHCCHMHTYKLIHPIVLKNTNTLIHCHSKLTNATLFNHIRFKRYTIFVAHERHRDCRLANNNSMAITNYNKDNSNNYNDIQKYIRCSFSYKNPTKTRYIFGGQQQNREKILFFGLYFLQIDDVFRNKVRQCMLFLSSFL